MFTYFDIIHSSIGLSCTSFFEFLLQYLLKFLRTANFVLVLSTGEKYIKNKQLVILYHNEN